MGPSEGRDQARGVNYPDAAASPDIWGRLRCASWREGPGPAPRWHPGTRRAKLLDQLIEAYAKLENEHPDIKTWSEEIVTLDAENKAGLKVKYQFRQLLAEADGKAYVITRVRTLAVMDNKTGKRLYSVNCASVTDHASNTGSNRMYVLDERGRVACLEPVR